MNFEFTIDNPMPPIWMMHPNISQFSIGWRMGYGEGYKWNLADWKKTLTKEEQNKYDEMFPHPVFWRKYYNEDYNFENTEEYQCGHVQLWNKNGEMKHSVDTIMKNQNALEFIFFWKPSLNVIDKSCLGQWQQSYFEVDMDTYSCAEQYMMAEKARLFEDEDAEAQIMQATFTPKK
jgi:hypothetical protein